VLYFWCKADKCCPDKFLTQRKTSVSLVHEVNPCNYDVHISTPLVCAHPDLIVYGFLTWNFAHSVFHGMGYNTASVPTLILSLFHIGKASTRNLIDCLSLESLVRWHILWTCFRKETQVAKLNGRVQAQRSWRKGPVGLGILKPETQKVSGSHSGVVLYYLTAYSNECKQMHSSSVLFR